MPIFLLFSLVFTMGASATTFTLTEATLQKMAAKGSPQLDQIEAAFLASQLQDKQTQEIYAPEVFGSATYSETNEKAIIPFQPVFSPIFQSELGVRKNLPQGLSATASVIADQRSAGRTSFTGQFSDVTTATLRFTLQVDLWKNLLGRVSKAQLLSAELEGKRSKLELEIQQKTFDLSLRRVFWALVANQEAQKISNELLKAAEKQLEDASLRLKNAVAEADEVARNRAQVASRQGGILYLQYQRQNLIRQLKNLLPELAGHEDIQVAGYDIQKTIGQVMVCTATIASQSQTPYDFTLYDEVIDLLKNIKKQSQTLNNRYAGPDVSLYGTVKTTGVDSVATTPDANGVSGFRGSYGGAREDFENNNRFGYEVGLSFSVPLGSVKASTEEVKRRYDDKRLEAQIAQTEAQVVNTHSTLVKTIEYLNQVSRAQRESSEQLQKRLGLMRKKYQQARVDINDVIQDQDAFLNSELTAIDTRLAILNTLFDYLAVFTNTPCELNRK